MLECTLRKSSHYLAKLSLNSMSSEDVLIIPQVLAQNTADAGSEQSIPHHQLDSDGTGLYSIVEVHPENNYEEFPSQEKSPGNRDNLVYATLDISDPQHEFIYANTDFVPSPVFTKSEEDFSTEVANRATKQYKK
uniref:Uncharacterized protein n=1 Tax=Sphaerodactylus townsendi TaxID=933632 RepID=A0ACB8ELG0_9SAUR